jgi:hypothetical protein
VGKSSNFLRAAAVEAEVFCEAEVRVATGVVVEEARGGLTGFFLIIAGGRTSLLFSVFTFAEEAIPSFKGRDDFLMRAAVPINAKTLIDPMTIIFAKDN